MKITIYRTAPWLYEQRLHSGMDIPECIYCEVNPSALSMEARKILLDESGYPMLSPALGFDREHNLLPRGGNWGRVNYVVDSIAPSPEELSQAICAAYAKIQAKKAEAELEKANAEALKVRIAAARLLLGDELAALNKALCDKDGIIANLRKDVSELTDTLEEAEDDVAA